jgi:hypothetical protein
VPIKVVGPGDTVRKEGNLNAYTERNRNEGVSAMSQPRGRPFAAGNTHGRGRPKGSPNKSSSPEQDVLDGYAGKLMLKCISMAGQGNVAALVGPDGRLVWLDPPEGCKAGESALHGADTEARAALWQEEQYRHVNQKTK